MQKASTRKSRSASAKASSFAGPTADKTADDNATALSEDVHIFIGGVCALRFFPSGQIQVPTCPEKRAALRRYLAHLDLQLEAYS